jgi:uncharacterized membrane protein YkvA (DUF1232 family)
VTTPLHVSLWAWTLVAAGLTVALYASLVAGVVVTGRRQSARALARFIPDCVVLFSRLLRDRRLSGSDKLLVGALIPYLALPFDLVPDFIPIAGQLDDAVLVALVLRRVVRRTEPGLLRELWPGPESSLGVVFKLAGRHELPPNEQVKP